MAEGDGQRCCCGCCTLRTGTKAIAVVWLMSCVFSVASYTWLLVVMSDGTDRNPFDWMVDPDNPYQDPKAMELMDDLFKNHRTELMAFSWVSLILALISAPTTILLLIAAVKNGPWRRIIPWVVYNGVTMVISLVYLILIVVYFSINLGAMYGGILAFEYALIYFGLIYLFRVVWLYMKEVRAAEEGPAEFENAGLMKPQ